MLHLYDHGATNLLLFFGCSFQPWVMRIPTRRDDSSSMIGPCLSFLESPVEKEGVQASIFSIVCDGFELNFINLLEDGKLLSLVHIFKD